MMSDCNFKDVHVVVHNIFVRVINSSIKVHRRLEKETSNNIDIDLTDWFRDYELKKNILIFNECIQQSSSLRFMFLFSTMCIMCCAQTTLSAM